MSYRAVLRDRTYTLLTVSTAAGRFAGVMFDIAVVIFIVQDLGQPAVAGLVVLLANLPGLILSPVSGSFLQGRDLTRWMAVDFAVKAAATLGIAFAPSQGAGSVWLLCALALLSSLTSAFGNVALRSYIALALRPELRGPANGLDSVLSGIAAMAGPAAAGVAAAVVGGRESVAVVGVLYLVAALVGVVSGRTLLEGGGDGIRARGLVEAVRTIAVEPTLRGLTGVYFLYQAAIGVLVVALPQLVTTSFGLDTSWTGASWSVAGSVGIVAALLAGRWIAPGLERRYLFVGTVTASVAIAGLFADATAWWLVAVFVLIGASVGPMDVGLLTLRQTALPEGRATVTLAVSASLNMSGYPAGAMVGGLLAGVGMTAQVGTAFGCGVLAVAITALIPRPRAGTSATPPGPTIPTEPERVEKEQAHAP
jgi:MFS family permease